MAPEAKEAWEPIPQRASGRTWTSTAWILSSELHFRVSECGTVGFICSVRSFRTVVVCPSSSRKLIFYWEEQPHALKFCGLGSA